MEPCLRPYSTELTCSSPPPDFNVPKPSWCDSLPATTEESTSPLAEVTTTPTKGPTEPPNVTGISSESFWSDYWWTILIIIIFFIAGCILGYWWWRHKKRREENEPCGNGFQHKDQPERQDSKAPILMPDVSNEVSNPVYDNQSIIPPVFSHGPKDEPDGGASGQQRGSNKGANNRENDMVLGQENKSDVNEKLQADESGKNNPKTRKPDKSTPRSNPTLGSGDIDQEEKSKQNHVNKTKNDRATDQLTDSKDIPSKNDIIAGGNAKPDKKPQLTTEL